MLMGHLSPIDGIGPAEIGLDHLEARFDNEQIEEVILATNPTVEGEATAFYIAERARQRGLRVTRIAHGVPLGGEFGIFGLIDASARAVRSNRTARSRIAFNG